MVAFFAPFSFHFFMFSLQFRIKYYKIELNRGLQMLFPDTIMQLQVGMLSLCTKLQFLLIFDDTFTLMLFSKKR